MVPSRLASLAIVVVASCTHSAVDTDELIADAATASPPDALADIGVDVPYDHAIQASAHNAFEREEPLLDQLVYDRIRSLELDIHSTKDGITAPAGSWFVFHEDLPLNRDSSCTTLADCLRLLSAFHAAVPQHEVVTLWLDLKAPFAPGHAVDDLDDAVAAALGRENLVTPGDLMERCPAANDLRSAVTAGCSFPTLGALRGKFIVGVTGGTLCNESDLVAQYAGVSARQRLAFVAPGITAGCPIEAYDAQRETVMLNLVYEQHDAVTAVRARGLVARVYRGLFSLNNADDFFVAKALGTNHIAMDMLDVAVDPWASTHSSTGYPFECEGCAPPVRESGALVALRATSGDVGGAADSMVAAIADQTADQTADQIIDALVSVPSSHVEPDAKACVIARESTAADAAGVALCRPFDHGAPELIVRVLAGGPTSTVTAQAIAGFRSETAAFLRLAVHGSEVVASTSVDGIEWVELQQVSLSGAPRIRGIAVASKTGQPVTAVFANLHGVVPTTVTAIGSGASGELLSTLP